MLGDALDPPRSLVVFIECKLNLCHYAHLLFDFKQVLLPRAAPFIERNDHPTRINLEGITKG